MQIDGAVNNDVFGLAATGTPGGQTGTQPVSLDAIQEIQLLVSPYDVRQGGFSGGGINAVTKSGTNGLHGGAYYFGRNQKFIGTIPALEDAGQPDAGRHQGRRRSATSRWASASAGRSCRTRRSSSRNFDWARKNTPVGFSADGSSGQQFSQQAHVQQVVRHRARTSTDYDPGGLGEFSKPNNSNKVFVRADFNLRRRHQLTVREQLRRRAGVDIGIRQSISTYKFPIELLPHDRQDAVVGRAVEQLVRPGVQRVPLHLHARAQRARRPARRSDVPGSAGSIRRRTGSGRCDMLRRSGWGTARMIS